MLCRDQIHIVPIDDTIPVHVPTQNGEGERGRNRAAVNICARQEQRETLSIGNLAKRDFQLINFRAPETGVPQSMARASSADSLAVCFISMSFPVDCFGFPIANGLCPRDNAKPKQAE